MIEPLPVVPPFPRSSRGRAPLAALLLFTLSASVACRRSPRALHVVWGQDILTLDPNRKFETATDTYAMNVFEPLLKLGPQATFVPILATRWETPDRKTWRFRLRPGVRFHDGTPLSADDVVFSIERARRDPKSELKPYLSTIEAVRSTDAATVEVVSDRPAGLLSVLSFVYVLPKESLSAKGEAEFFRHPVGTGPYVFVSWEPKKLLVLRSFEGHWRERPMFETASFHFVGPDGAPWEKAAALRPSILMDPTRTSWNEKRGDARFRLLSRPGMTVHALMLNVKPRPGNPLVNVHVRRALRAAVDTKALVDTVSAGQYFPASQPVTPDVFGHDPSLAVPLFVPGQARRVLAEAGFPNGLSLTLNASPGQKKLVDELVRQLGAAGVRVTVHLVEADEFYERTNRCDGDLQVGGYICSTGDAAELFEGVFHSTAATGPEAQYGCGYHRPELDALIDEAARTLDPRVRRDTLQAAMRLTMEDAAWIPLIVPFDRYALSPELVWEARADGEIYLPDVSAR